MGVSPAMVIPEIVRNFGPTAPAHVRTFYREAHVKRTVEEALRQYYRYKRRRLEVPFWHVVLIAGHIRDASDGDAHLAQIVHQYATGDLISTEGGTILDVLWGLIHDVGKLLAAGHLDPSVEFDDDVRRTLERIQEFAEAFREFQYNVVGDIYPNGAKFEDGIVMLEYFAGNPDSSHPVYNTELGMYDAHCGLENLLWPGSHDGFIADRVQDYAIVANWEGRLGHSRGEIADFVHSLRFHSAYGHHSPEPESGRDVGYKHFMSTQNWDFTPNLQARSRRDRYGKPKEIPALARFNEYPMPLDEQRRLRAMMEERFKPIIDRYFPVPFLI